MIVVAQLEDRDPVESASCKLLIINVKEIFHKSYSSQSVSVSKCLLILSYTVSQFIYTGDLRF